LAFYFHIFTVAILSGVGGNCISVHPVMLLHHGTNLNTAVMNNGGGNASLLNE
jgi:UDP-N-acetyl-D-mannosaminuronate dehydrogenase